MKKKSIILFVKTPPPLTGATLMNSTVLKSTFLYESYKIRVLGLTYAASLKNLGAFKIRKLFIFFNIFFRLISNLISVRPDLVYFQISPLGIAFLRDAFFVTLIKFFNVKIVFHLHGKGIKQKIQNRSFLKKIYKYVLSSEYVICLSESLITDIEDVYEGKPFIVGNAIESIESVMNKIKPLPSGLNLNVLFLSNLIISKGILVFLDTVELIANRYGTEGFNFSIVGASADLDSQKLSKEITKRNLQNSIIYKGPLYDDSKLAMLSETDILIYPTLNDTWGLVILEAMMCGIPVIASKEGAIPEIIIDGKTGYLVNKSSPSEIVDKIMILKRSPHLREAMGNAARMRFAENYTIDKFERNMANVFNRIFDAI